MAQLQMLAPWLLMLAGLLASLLWTAALSVLVFVGDGPAVSDPQVIPASRLLHLVVRATPPAILVAAIAAAIGLRSGARWAIPLALGVSVLLIVGGILGMITSATELVGGDDLRSVALFHILGPAPFLGAGLNPAAIAQGTVAVIVLAGMLAARRASTTAASPASASYSARRIERWVAALIAALALEHAAVAAFVLIRGVTIFEGTIVVSAPVFVITGLGIGLGVLRGRAWARPALVVASVPVAFWTLYIGGVFAYFLSENVYRVETGAVLVAMFVVATLIAASVVRRTAERVS